MTLTFELGIVLLELCVCVRNKINLIPAVFARYSDFSAFAPRPSTITLKGQVHILISMVDVGVSIKINFLGKVACYRIWVRLYYDLDLEG